MYIIFILTFIFLFGNRENPHFTKSFHFVLVFSVPPGSNIGVKIVISSVKRLKINKSSCVFSGKIV